MTTHIFICQNVYCSKSGQHTFFTCENVCCPKTGEFLIVYFLDDIKNTAVYLGLVNNGIWLL